MDDNLRNKLSSVGMVTHDFDDALRRSLLFFRAQRSGSLGTDNPIPWRKEKAFMRDGKDAKLVGKYHSALFVHHMGALCERSIS